MSSNTPQLAPLAASIDDTARILGISRRKIQYEIEAGRLRAVKMGTKTLLPTDQFPGWLQSLKPVEPRAAA